jgi:hypothetical protein
MRSRVGTHRSGAKYPRDTLFKGRSIQELLVRDTSVRDTSTLHLVMLRYLRLHTVASYHYTSRRPVEKLTAGENDGSCQVLQASYHMLSNRPRKAFSCYIPVPSTLQEIRENNWQLGLDKENCQLLYMPRTTCRPEVLGIAVSWQRMRKAVS